MLRVLPSSNTEQKYQPRDDLSTSTSKSASLKTTTDVLVSAAVRKFKKTSTAINSSKTQHVRKSYMSVGIKDDRRSSTNIVKPVSKTEEENKSKRIKQLELNKSLKSNPSKREEKQQPRFVSSPSASKSSSVKTTDVQLSATAKKLKKTCTTANSIEKDQRINRVVGNRGKKTTDPKQRITEFEAKVEQLGKSESLNTSKNKEKPHTQDFSFPSTLKFTSIETKYDNLQSSASSDELLKTENTHRPHSVQNETYEKEVKTYKKRKGTDDHGKEYEYLMCAYYALKLTFDENVTDFEITTNNEIYLDLDDVALKVTFSDGSSRNFLMQLKHTEQNKGLTDNMLSTKKGDFSLLKYFESFQNLQDRDNTSCILFTNRKSQLRDKSKFKLKDENVTVNQCLPQNLKDLLLIDTVSDAETAAHVFNFEQNGHNSQNFKDFFRNFYLFTNQKNCRNIRTHIDELLTEKFGCEIDFNNFMRQWWKGNFVFTRHDVIAKLAELVLSPFIQEIPKNVKETLSNQANLLREAIMQFEMTLVKDCDANNVAKVWMEGSSDLADVDVEKISEIAFKYGLTTKGLKDIKDLTSKDFTKVLWYLNKAPLIVKYDEEEEETFRAAIQLLATEATRKKLILVGQKPKEAFPNWKIFETLHDLRNEAVYNQITETFNVSLQERPSISLKKFIDSNIETAKVIETKELFSMLEKDLSIGKALPSLPVAYIPRTLSRDSIFTNEAEAFSTFNNSVNVVIGKPGIGKSTLMTYLSHKCPPECWCIRVNLIKFTPLFSRVQDTEDILSVFLSGEDSLFYRVKATFQQNKKIYLLLDGLDEIANNCVENVLKFVHDVSLTGIRVWISSRKHLEDKVSSYFKISPITIEELTRENQEKYIEQRLCCSSSSSSSSSKDDENCVKYTEDEVKDIINGLFTSVNVVYNAENILGVPLLLYIITEIFRYDRSNLEKLKNEDIFVLTKMYKIFFEGKEKHLYKKAGVQNEALLDNDLDYQLKQYELPALEASTFHFLEHFELDSKKTSKSQKFLEKIRNRGDQRGIISQVVEEKNHLRAIYSHQSFAEYFACVWLKNNKEKLSLIKNVFFKSFNQSLRLIFDIMLAEDNPLQLAVLYKNPEQVERYIDHHEEQDKGGRTPLHLISSYCENILNCSFYQKKEKSMTDVKILQLLLRKCNLAEKDIIFNWNCFDYALCRNSLLLFEVILETREETIDLNNIVKQFDGLNELVECCCFWGYSRLLKMLIQSYPEDVKQLNNLMSKVIYGSDNVTEIYIIEKYSEIVKQFISYGYNINNTFSDFNNTVYNTLELSCQSGNYNMVKILLEHGGNLHFVDYTRRTLLHLASENDNSDIIKLLLEKGCKVNVTDEDNSTPLHYACENGSNNAVRTILELGGDLNAVTNKRETPLHLALENGNTDIIELLLKKGCNINMGDENNWTHLHYACRYGRYNAVVKILELGADLNAVTNKKRTSLHLASENGNVDIIELLVKKGCDINVVDEDNWTPLHYACDNGKYNAVRTILELGGDFNAIINNKITSLHLASANGNHEIIKLLIKNGCEVNVCDENNWTPLHYACENGKYNAVKTILELGADSNAVINKKITSLHLSSANGNIEIIKLLVKKGCKVNVGDENSWTPLHYACSYQRYNAVKTILEIGGDVDAVMDKKITSLHLASANGSTEIIELLVKKGCSVNLCDENDWTALHYACFHGKFDAVLKILELEGDLEAITNKKQTLLHLASKRGNVDIIELLLKKGCKVSVGDENNLTSLHYACRYGRYHAVKKILELGDDLAPTSESLEDFSLSNGLKYINATGENNWTPLRYACDEKNYDIIEALLENGACLDTESRNFLTQNLYDLLCQGKIKLVDLLLQRQTNINGIDSSLALIPPEFPISLAKRDGHLQPHLLLRMAKLINKYYEDNVHCHRDSLKCGGIYIERLTRFLNENFNNREN